MRLLEIKTGYDLRQKRPVKERNPWQDFLFVIVCIRLRAYNMANL